MRGEVAASLPTLPPARPQAIPPAVMPPLAVSALTVRAWDDRAGRERLLSAMAALADELPDLATVTVTHHLEELPASTTHALLMRSGMVASSGPVGATLTGERLSECFGIPVAVRRTTGRWTAHAAHR